MKIEKLSTTILNIEYDIELEFLDMNGRDSIILLTKIKSQDGKCFTYEFRFSRTLLASIKTDLDKYIKEESSKIVNNLISNSELEDKIIEISSSHNVKTSSPPYELKKHSECKKC